MKKFLAIFLVLALLLSFAACKKDDTYRTDVDGTTESSEPSEQTNEADETTTKKPGKKETTTAAPFENPNVVEPAALLNLVGLDNYNLTSAEPNTSKTSGVTFIAKRYENKSSAANILPAQISTGGTDFVLNETLLKDFIATGWTVISKKDANTAAEAGAETSVILKNNSGETTKLVVTNKSTVSMPLGECPITEIGILKSITEQTWADFTVGGVKVTSGKSYADFINAFGKPVKINVSEYYKGNDYTHSKVTLIFEKKVGNETWNMSLTCVDTKGNIEIESCIYEVK
ncbi:MAG: hypothetical protein IJZ16_04390 [Clostridia bacterium]|nr:hypothetical protein [Clostridia bacterium]